MEEVTVIGLTRLLQSEAPVIVLLLIAVIVALWACWKLYTKSDALLNSRVASVEQSLASCMAAHERCDRRNQQLAHALADLASGREAAALASVNSLLGEGGEGERR